MYYEIRLLLPLPLQAVSVDPLAECLQLILHFEVSDTQLVVKGHMIFLRLHNAPSDSRVLLPTFAFDFLDLF